MKKEHKKKLRKEDIVRNSSSEISHTIKKIKDNEKKYTIILVCFFFIVFCLIGYFSLRINENDIIYNDSIPSVSLTDQEVNLSKDNIISDFDGLNSDGIDLSIKNHINQTVSYRIMFVKDNENQYSGESNISFDNIRFSKDGITVEKFSSLHSMIVKEGKIEKQKQKKINIKMWLDEKTKVTESSHFHGHFIIETP